MSQLGQHRLFNGRQTLSDGSGETNGPDAERHDHLVRHARIRMDAGAELIRRIVPGSAVTHDFRGYMITLAVNPAGNVVQANCE